MSFFSVEYPRVAVALAVYNGEKWLEEQVATVLLQKNVNITVYLSVDPSEDRSKKVAEYICNKNENVILLSPKESSGSAAMNFFRIMMDVDVDKYDYFSFCDQDDLWLSEKLIEAIRCLESSNSEVYSSNLNTFGLSNILVKKCYSVKSFDYLFQGASAGCTYVISKNTAIFLKSVIEKNITNFPQRPSHDWLIYAICRSHEKKWYFDSRSFVLYRQHENNVRGAVKGISGYINRLEVSRTGWYRQHILKMKPFLRGTSDELEIINHIESMSLVDRLWLMMRVNKFRRRFREQVMLFFVFMFNMF